MEVKYAYLRFTKTREWEFFENGKMVAWIWAGRNGVLLFVCLGGYRVGPYPLSFKQAYQVAAGDRKKFVEEKQAEWDAEVTAKSQESRKACV